MDENRRNGGGTCRGRPKKDKSEVKSKRLVVRMDEDAYERLDLVANRLKTTRSNVIRTLIFEAENILKRR